MNKPQLNIIIDEPGWETAVSEIEQVSQLVAETVFNYIFQNEAIDILANVDQFYINLSLSNDITVQALNREFRGLDKPTNVLSFANLDDPEFADCIAQENEVELGDIIIALETMQQQALDQGVSLHDHYCHLLAHGLLHLLGYDHQTTDEANQMESFETAVLQTLNITNPYEE